MSKLKKLASKKSYSWWWDSHISPKNSKWLDENLLDMDKLVKQMLRLIEDDGDSFAKKAEMYYQKRPELISNVEEFYRMYRALAERYDNVTGELRRSMPSKKNSFGSDGGSLSPINSHDHTPKKKHIKVEAGHRAAGFDVFLGSGGSSDISRKGSGSSSSSSSDSESDSDDMKEGSLHFEADEQHQRISELESELEELRRRLAAYEEGSNGTHGHDGNGNQEDLNSRLQELEMELANTTGRLNVSEVEIERLQQELETRIQAQNDSNNVTQELSVRVSELEMELTSANARLQTSEEELKELRNDLAMKGLTDDAEREQICVLESKVIVLENEIKRLEQELETKTQAQNDSSNSIQELTLRVVELEADLTDANTRLQSSHEEVKKLRDDLGMKESTDEAEREQISMLERKITVLEAEIIHHQNEIEELKSIHPASVDQLRNDISERDVAIEELKVECAVISDRHQQEKLQLEGEIVDRNHTIEQLNNDLSKFSEEKSVLENKLSQLEQEVDNLRETTATSNEKFLLEKQQLESVITSLSNSHSSLALRFELLEGAKRQLESEKKEAYAASNQQMSDLTRQIDEMKTRLDMLTSEKDGLDAQVSFLLLEIKSRDGRISDMDAHLHQLHMEHVKLIKEAQEANKANEDLRVCVAALQEEVEKQRVVIYDSAEGKREAIRQLCFSLEHYRLGYQELRQALIGHKRTQAQTAVLAS